MKEWKQTEESIKFFQETIDQGLSIGIYIKDKLVGFVLLAYIEWNNSMWIENIRINQDYQGSGLGKKLIEKSVDISKQKGVRILGLEVQSTNYPAINFYKKCGFEILGIDFYRYPIKNENIEEMAVLMNITL